MTTKMKPTYKIFVLNDQEFENLHEDMPELKAEDLKEGLGFANPKTKEAFVRRSKDFPKEWTDETIIHEAMELISKTSPHEEDGIRWKKGKDIFTRIVAPIAVGALTGGLGLPAIVGTGLGAVGGAIHGYQSGKGKGALLGGLTGGLGASAGGSFARGFKAPGTTAITGATGPSPVPVKPTFGQRLLGGIKGVTGTGAVGNVGGTTAPFVPTMGGKAIPTIQAGGAEAMKSVTGFPTAALGATRGVTTVGAPITPTTVGAGGITAKPTESVLGKVGEILKRPETQLGLATLAAPAVLPTPQFQMPTRISELEEQFINQRGLSEVGRVARGELIKTLQANPSELYPVASDKFIEASLRGVRERYAKAQEQLDANYNLAGTFGSGEHMAEKAKLQEELARTESDFITLENQRRFELAQQTKQNATVQALKDAGLTEAHIMDIAALSVQEAAAKYGAELADMAAIKEALGTLGTELVLGGIKGGFQQQTT